MRLRRLLEDDDAVSPVIGVILMVAITVILAAVIASFVLGLGPSDATPQAQFSGEVDGSDLTIEHTGGDNIRAGNVDLSGTLTDVNGNEKDIDTTWVSASDGSGVTDESDITTGDSATVSASNDIDTYDITVTWAKDDQTSELASIES